MSTYVRAKRFALSLVGLFIFIPSFGRADQSRDRVFEQEALRYIRQYAKPKKISPPKNEILFARPSAAPRAAAPTTAPQESGPVSGSVLTPDSTSMPTNAPAFAQPNQATPAPPPPPPPNEGGPAGE